MNYKATLRIPAKEPYAYIEVQVDGEPETIVEGYNYFTKLINNPTVQAGGLDRLDFNKALDQYLLDKSMDSDAYEKMSDSQKAVVQELKKAFKRIIGDGLENPLKGGYGTGGFGAGNSGLLLVSAGGNVLPPLPDKEDIKDLYLEEKDHKEYIRLCRLVETGTDAQKKMAKSKLKAVYGEDMDKGMGDGEGEPPVDWNKLNKHE